MRTRRSDIGNRVEGARECLQSYLKIIGNPVKKKIRRTFVDGTPQSRAQE
jgi:hypothetical protein